MLSSLCQQFGKDTGYLPSPLFAYVDIKWFPKSAANEGDRGFSREPSDGCAVIQLLALPSLPPSLCCSPEAQLLPWQAFPCTHTGLSQLQASPADNKVNQTTPYLSITDTSLSQSTHVPHVSSPAASQHPPEKKKKSFSGFASRICITKHFYPSSVVSAFMVQIVVLLPGKTDDFWEMIMHSSIDRSWPKCN